MKKLRITNVLIFCIVASGLVFISPGFSSAALNVVKIWNDKTDWSSWTKINLQNDLLGGLRLSDDPNGGFVKDGQANFQFSPGGTENSWVNATHVVQDKITDPNNHNQLIISFSTDNQSWYSEGDLDSGKIPDSPSLYIKSVFHGDGTNTPVLKSITLSYATKEEPKLLMFKRTFMQDPATKTLGQETSTFEPGDTAIVRVKIDPMGLSNLNLNVRDYRPKAAAGLNTIKPITTTLGCGLNATDNLLSATFSADNDKDYSEWSNVKPSSGLSYLCYQYTLDNTDEPKNDLVQSKLIAYDQNNFDANQPYNQAIATFSGYSMVRGFAFANSESNPVKLDDGSITPQVSPINDFLSFARTNISYTANSNQTSNLSYSASYVYNRGLGPNSRGGDLYSLPVKMEDDAGEVIATDQSYILYNPAFYLFGNLFSGSTSPSKLDFSSRSGGTSNQKYPTDFSSKLNSEASLYNYFFDKNSVLYWDNTAGSADTEYKNTQMTQSIKDLITNKPPEFCDKGANTSPLKTGNTLYLDGPNCNNPAAVSDNTWPNGRVWYFKTSGTVNIAATFHGRGTVIIDGSTTVNISTTAGSFFDSNTSLGLIVINGGKVVFTKAATAFNGIVFAPGN